MTLANHSKRERRLARKEKEPTLNRTIGIILIALGLVGLVLGGVSYTTKEKIIDIGPIEASRDKTHSIPLSPLAGAAALIGGIVLLAMGKKEA